MSARMFTDRSRLLTPLPDCGFIVDDEYGGLGLSLNRFRWHELAALGAFEVQQPIRMSNAVDFAGSEPLRCARLT
jgi:hypothetical protein